MARPVVRNIFIFAACLTADLASKAVALALGAEARNTGAAFSLGAGLVGGGPLFSVLGAAALAALAALAPDARRSAGMAMMAAGVIGNAADRLARGFVVDWLPLFGLSWNLADIWLCLGGAMILLALARGERGEPPVP